MKTEIHILVVRKAKGGHVETRQVYNALILKTKGELEAIVSSMVTGVNLIKEKYRK